MNNICTIFNIILIVTVYFRTHNLKVGTHEFSNMMKIARITAKVARKRLQGPSTSRLAKTSPHVQDGYHIKPSFSHSLFRYVDLVPDKRDHQDDVKPKQRISEKQVVPNIMATYMSSIKAVAAREFLAKFKKEKCVPVMDDFIAVRNYILVMICVSNGSRAGTLLMLSHKHVKRVQTSTDGQMVFSVCFRYILNKYNNSTQ